MNRIRNLLVANSDKLHHIVIAQYKRADYSIGEEENFHWAIVVLEKIAVGEEFKGPCYQVFDRHYNDERGIQWNLFNKPVSLDKTEKSLGGISIGTIKRKDLDELDQILSNHLPVVKFAGWNCRDWVMEAIGLMKAKGWIPHEITEQAILLPALRAASAASHEAKRPRIVLLEGGTTDTWRFGVNCASSSQAQILES
ncbi:hypothetical protein QCA50_014805 [Cerrena zonata]|uniref:Uncharacterized protein n=1 Tax=Cerrena zonata TaxID=2478898 RepID=A0AAW0FX83_9APHY